MSGVQTQAAQIRGSRHKDFSDNLYCVVYGEKVFELLPPSAILQLEEAKFPRFRYVRCCASKRACEPIFYKHLCTNKSLHRLSGIFSCWRHARAVSLRRAFRRPWVY